MKIKLLFAFLAFSLFSCSSDESTPVNTNPETENPETENPENPVPMVKNLLKVEEFANSNLAYPRKKYEFENNQVTKVYDFYDLDIITQTTYTYNENNFLVYAKYENFDLGYTEYNFTYDNSGRITNKDVFSSYQDFLPSHTSYDYLTPNKIIANMFNDQNISTGNQTATLDENDYVVEYKLSSSPNSDLLEATYDGHNITTQTYKTYNNSTQQYDIFSHTTFTYLEQEVKGEYLKAVFNRPEVFIGLNQFGSLKSNAALARSGNSVNAVNYLSSWSYGGDTYTREYQFDSDGYPVIVQTFKNGEIQYEDHITYE